VSSQCGDFAPQANIQRGVEAKTQHSPIAVHLLSLHFPPFSTSAKFGVPFALLLLFGPGQASVISNGDDMGMGGVGAVGGAVGGAMAGAAGVSSPTVGFTAVGDAGALGASGAAGAAGTAGAGSAGAAGAAGVAGATGGTGLFGPHGIDLAMSSASAQQMQQLMQLLKDFNSADILLALMLMRASEKKDKSSGDDAGALLCLLAGLALAGQVSQLTGQSQNTVPNVAQGAQSGVVGTQMNLQA
jgi:hypothetical protein